MIYTLRYVRSFISDDGDRIVRPPMTTSELRERLSHWRNWGWFRNSTPQVLVGDQWVDIPIDATVEDVDAVCELAMSDDGRP